MVSDRTAHGEPRGGDAPAPPRGALAGLFGGQLTTALNANALQVVVTLLVGAAVAGADAAERQTAADRGATWALLAFVLPLLVLSIPGGVLADRVDRRTLLVGAKGAEVLVLAAAAVTLALDPTGIALPLVLLAAVAALAGLSSPARYGIVPDLVRHGWLSAANAALEFWTFLGAIGGTVLAATLLQAAPEAPWVAPAALAAAALAGLFAFRTIPRGTPGVAERRPPLDSVGGAWRAIRRDRVLSLTVLGQAFFWGIASLLSYVVLVVDPGLLATSRVTGNTVPLAGFAVGYGLGLFAAAKLSGKKVELGLVPLGALGMGAFTLLTAAVAPGAFTIPIVGCLGVSAGLLVVPLDAVIQWRAPHDRRGSVIGLANALVFAGILAGPLAAHAAGSLGLSAREVLVGAAVATAVGTVWALWLLPQALLRLVLVVLTHTIYRVKVIGRPNVPERGGALLVPNHVTFVDGLFLLASLDRRVRFLIQSEHYHNPFLRPVVATLGAIPIAATGGPRVILRALRTAGEYLDAGELVCIFPEGQLTRTGALNPFRRGMERIAKGRTAPIVPVHLDRLWGSVFSREGGRYLWKLPRELPYRVTVSYGAPLPPDTPLFTVRRAVQELGERAWESRKAERPALHRTFLRTSRRHPFRMAIVDATRPPLSRIKAVTGAVALAHALRSRWEGQEHVGILLPPSVGAALANVAAAFAGRAVVNLNYTAGPAGMTSAARQAGLRTVLTSRLFLEKAKIEPPAGVEPILLEEVARGIGSLQRLRALALAAFAPAPWLERSCGTQRARGPDDVTTIIFSSGSTGEPKGVILTHFNVDANVEAVNQAMRLTGTDRILGVLPFFHSFGYLSLWVAANHGLGLVLHVNPLDAPAVGELVERHRCTVLLATPTFLQMYLRRCTPEQFSSLRIVMVGAEKLTDRLAQAFEERFGIRPLEGYGTTECAPAVAVNTPDFRAPGYFQIGSRRGTVGQPLPGVSVRIVDPDTFAPLPPDTPGLLLVRGPNVMRGYLGRDDLTAAALHEGWYVTGDVAAIDADGFVRITDRLSRFSKIGGEMVPHGRVEEALHVAAAAAGVAPPEGQVFAVTGLPDERKGERLAVVTTLPPAAIPPTLEHLGTMGLPNLFLPRPDSFVHVEAIPVLGTGKTDLRGVKRIAAEALARE